VSNNRKKDEKWENKIDDFTGSSCNKDTNLPKDDFSGTFWTKDTNLPIDTSTQPKSPNDLRHQNTEGESSYDKNLGDYSFKREGGTSSAGSEFGKNERNDQIDWNKEKTPQYNKDK